MLRQQLTVLALFFVLHPVLSFVTYPEAFTKTTPQLELDSPSQDSRSKAPSHRYKLDGDEEDDDDGPLPVVIWHGLGDAYDNEGLKDVAKLLDEVHPGTYTYIIRLGADGSADRSATFFGNVTQQVMDVCDQLGSDPILRTAPAIDAIGFSQGGQFLRGYVETCNVPKVRSLITFGSQHNGISKFQTCKETGDWLCKGAEAMLKAGGAFAGWVQSRIVPAQYFRDPEDLDTYLASSVWLADVNNERVLKNQAYKENLSQLEKFVMVMFEDDTTVIPKQSSWFDEVNLTTGEVTKLKDRPIYIEDWLGLKTLDDAGALVFETVKGGHMQLDDTDLKSLFGTYFGPLKNATEEKKGWKADL